MATAPSSIATIIKRFTRPGAHPDEGRAQLHLLGPERMPELLAMATSSTGAAVDLLAITMADVVYPPALPQFRVWLDEGHFDLQVTAACALDAALDKRFKIVELIGGPRGLLVAAMDHLRVAWDAAPAVPDEDAWLATERRKRAADANLVPPRSPALSAADAAARAARMSEIARILRRLPKLLAHRVEHRFATRLMPLWATAFPDDDTLDKALAVVGRYVDGAEPSAAVWAIKPAVSQAIGNASKAAAYSGGLLSQSESD